MILLSVKNHVFFAVSKYRKPQSGVGSVSNVWNTFLDHFDHAVARLGTHSRAVMLNLIDRTV